MLEGIEKRATEEARYLAAGGCTVAQAAESAGFADASAFYRAFRARYHTTPKKLLSLEREDAGV